MKWYFKKVKGGALQYTLFISVVIVVLLSSFLMYTYLQHQFNLQSDDRIRCIQQAELGFQLAANKTLVPYGEKSFEIDDSEHKILFERKPWGLFDILKVKSTLKKHSFIKYGLLGGNLTERSALYLKDNQKQLVVVGHTRIEGITYLPKKHIKRGNIAGHSYYQKELVFGPTYTSETTLPKIENLDALRSFIKQLSIDTERFEPFDLEEGLQSINSFSNPTQYYYNSKKIYLNDVSLTGNIIIQSSKSIIVDASAILNDVLLIAPVIEIKDEVTGVFQSLATDHIRVGTNCQLSYPSSLVVMESKKASKPTTETASQNEPRILISKGSTIDGIVVDLLKQDKNRYLSQSVIESGAIINGEVYCENNLELQGTVIGSVYCDQFLVRKFGSIYQNHLYNGTIVGTELPHQFCGLQFESSKLKVAKWLY